MANTNEGPATPPLTAQQQMDRVWFLATLVLCVAIIAVVAYCYIFRNHPAGGPEAWAQFGDYFGGIINPIVGMVTVMLVIITLGATRREAAAQRGQFQLQLDDFRRQQTLAEHQKRLDGALASWQALMGNTLNVDRAARTGLLGQLQGRKLGDSLADPNLYTTASLREAGHSPAVSAETHDALIHVLVLLAELAEYTKAYDEVVKSHLLTDYYRRRVHTAAFVLHCFELLDPIVAKELTPRS